MTVAFGVDIGRRHDLTVIEVWEQVGDDSPAYLRLLRPLSDTPFDEQQDAISALAERHNPDIVAGDENGIGMETMERLRRRLGCTVLPVATGSEKVRAEMVGVSYNYFTSGRVRVPGKYRRVLEEFANIRKEISPAGRILFRDSPHGDLAWSAMLALYGLAWAIGADGAIGDANALLSGPAPRSAVPGVDLPRLRPGVIQASRVDGSSYPIKVPTESCDECARVFHSKVLVANHKALDHAPPLDDEEDEDDE